MFLLPKPKFKINISHIKTPFTQITECTVMSSVSTSAKTNYILQNMPSLTASIDKILPQSAKAQLN
jgi:hypothetical protein